MDNEEVNDLDIPNADEFIRAVMANVEADLDQATIPEFVPLALEETEDEHVISTGEYQIARIGETGYPSEVAEDAAESAAFQLSANTQFVRNYIKERNEEDIASVWLKSPPGDVATKLIRLEWYRRLVPKIYAPKRSMHCLHLSFDEDLAQEVLVNPLEKYIFNNEDPIEYFEKLEKMCSPALLCGRVFKAGEPTYGCRDCGLDPTCVLCVDCFNNSAHKSHRYKISTSGGGGYCDCGDQEAWKNNFYCDCHNPDLISPIGTKLDDIQPGLKERIDLILSVALAYCYNRFVDNNTVVLSPNELTLTDQEKEELDLKDNDLYCTALYNDEFHTFEVVIQTLQRAINCSKREAIEYATMIDREGRSLVKISDFTECAKVKQVSERQTSRTGQQPLKIEVLHSFVVAHEIFALKLVGWIKKLVSCSAEIREIFYDIMTRTSDLTRPPQEPQEEEKFGKPQGYLNGIFRCDTDLWKAQRSAWHNLLIAGMLRDYDMKKQFAIEFTKRYPELFKDFITDDHDHAISITSLSVQIYTVPTISLYLLEEHNVIFTIMRTFVSEFEQKLNADSKLQLQRSPNAPFKRAQYAILDVKYLLTNPPNEWNDLLRKPFIQGVSCVVKLLSWMQEMDPIVRQTGAHAEYEPEWETAFNFHIKLTPVTNLIQHWCSTDEVICIRAYRIILQFIRNMYRNKNLTTCCRELVNHSATCYEYDVLTKEVSIHLPLTRFAAGLQLLFDKFGLNFNSQQFTMEDKPTPLVLMEPSLRTLVLVVQVHCGLWKRNGFALLNQLYFYHNVKCRSDMLDKDILCMQIGASLIESNEYLLHLLNRFGLMAWVEQDFDDTPANVDDDNDRCAVVIAEQFLTLINTIISARYVVGVGDVTQKDCVQNEIIQYLCKEPMTHSSLNKVLVENLYCETGLEQYIQEVATFKKHTGAKAGLIYELKAEFYEKYDVFHYHFTHEEMATAEERQRSRKKAAREPEYFPPPRFPLFSEQFTLVPNILKSDVMMHILALVLTRSLKKSSRSFNDNQLRMVLHLIGQGLNEEAARNEVEQEHFFQFSSAAKQWKIFDILEKLLQESALSHHHELVLWLFKSYRMLKPSEDLSALESIALLSQSEEEKDKKKKLAAEIRQKRLAEMNAAQKNFCSVNAELFRDDEMETEETPSDARVVCENSVALGIGQTKGGSIVEKRICILCHNEEILSEATSAFVLCTFVQRSTVMAQCREVLLEAEKEKLGEGHLMQRDPLYLQPDLLSAPHVSCCGHAMHALCWKKHYEGVVAKERRRPYRHPTSFDIDSNEYLCPMCGCLSNTVLLIVEQCRLSNESETINSENSFQSWRNLWRDIVRTKYSQGHHRRPVGHVTFQVPRPDMRNRTEDLTVWDLGPTIIESKSESVPVLENFYYNGKIPYNRRISPTLLGDEISKTFFSTVFSIGLDASGVDLDYRLPIMIWQSVSFTIISFEANHRELKLPFFGESVPTRQTETMTTLARSGSLLTKYAATYLVHRFINNEEEHDPIQSLAVKLMDVLVNPSDPLVQTKQPCILEIDAFTILVSLTYSTDYIFGSKLTTKSEMGGSDIIGLKDLYLLRLVTTIHIAQILISNSFIHCVRSESHGSGEEMKESEGIKKFAHTCTCLWSFIDARYPTKNMNWDKVWKAVQDAATPFLRCAGKFYECLTGIAPGKCLHGVETSFEDLVRYLGLPFAPEEYIAELDDFTFAEYFLNPKITSVLLSNKRFREEKGVVPKVPMVKFPRRIGNLAKLPLDYAELINSVSLFTCQNCDDSDSRTPTMCLICGAILCSQSYCCQQSFHNTQVGACTYHAYYCGGGCGIFLRIRECKVFYLCGKNKGSFIFPPYLDAYGETDQGLRRGNPMTLSLEKYDNYRRSWMSHSIPEEIARITEHSTTITVAEWQYL